MASRQLKEGGADHSLKTTEWLEVVKRSCSAFRVLKWKIVIVDEEMDEEPARQFYSYFARALSDAFGRTQDSIRPVHSLEELEEPNSSQDDIDLLFIGVPESQTGPTRFQNIFKIPASIQRRKQVTPFPLLIALGNESHVSTAGYTLAQGIDFYLNRDALWPQSTEPQGGPGKEIQELVAAALSFRDWKFDRAKYLTKITGSLRTSSLPESFIEGDSFFTTEERKYLLLKLVSHLPKISRVVVRNRLNKGLSGAAFVGVVDPIQANGNQLLPRVVKIDRADRLMYEKANYDRYVVGNIDNFCGRIEPVVAVADSIERHAKDNQAAQSPLAALAYTAVGISDDYEQPGSISDFDEELGQRYLTNAAPSEIPILQKIDLLYSKILKPFYRPLSVKNGDARLSSLAAYYRAYIRPQLELIFESSRESTSKREADLAVQNSRLSFFRDDRCVVEYIQRTHQDLHLTVRQKRSNYYFRLFVPPKHLDRFESILLRRGKEIEFTAQVSKTLPDLLDEKLLEAISVLKIKRPEGQRPADLLHQITEGATGSLFLDPLLCFREVELSARSLTQSNRGMRVSIVHGDLHLRNIMYTASTDSLWLIDFARTGPGHTCVDFTIPEVYIRQQMMAKIICQEIDLKHDRLSRGYLAEFIRRVSRLEESFLKVGHDPLKELDERNERVVRLMQPIFQIRKNALFEAECGILEYLLSLYFCSIKGLTFNFTSSSRSIGPGLTDPYPRLYAYVLAGVLCRRLREIGQF